MPPLGRPQRGCCPHRGSWGLINITIMGPRAMRDRPLFVRDIVRVKSLVIAIALTGISWNFGPQADTAVNRSLGFYLEAGAAAADARQSADDPVSALPFELASW